MEDVLLNYLLARKRNSSETGKNAAAASDADRDPSWTNAGNRTPGPDSDVFLRPSLPFPLGPLFQLIETHRDYSQGCAKLAEFLKQICGQHALEDVLLQAMQSRFSRVWMERFIFTLLDVSPSDSQTAAYVLQFRHLKRMLLRVERQTPLNAVESGLARELIAALSLSQFLDFEAFCRQAADAFATMQAGRIPVSGDLGLLVYLIRCECTAMGERKQWLESESASGDPEHVARLTPHLRLLEARMQKADELARRIGGFGPLEEAPMGLEAGLGAFFFAHLKECLAKSPSLGALKEALELQEKKRVPTRDLIALTSLCRWLMEARGAPAGPLEWVRMALEAYDRGHFRLDVAGGLPSVEVLLAEAKVEREGTLVLGNFGENPYSCWIARDDLTRPFRSSNPDRIAPDVRATVMANLHRDTILLKLLDNPKVYGFPGMVEAIVEGNRSPLVHSKIASRRELHLGAVNGRVPAALLRSPVSISSTLLRSLIHPSVVSFTEMKTLYRGRSALRQEVAEELQNFLKRAYAI